MKKLLFIAAVCCTFSFIASAQHSTADVFTVEEVTFYGLDFSNIKLIGSDGFTDPWDIKNRLFNSWNMLFTGEPEKYDVAAAIKKSKVNINLNLVRERNKIPDPNELVIDEDYSFGKEVVEKTIAEYNTPEESGIGMVFIMESFDKNRKRGFMWVTFFDIATKNVLLTEKLSGKAQGFGIRNYYAKTYHNVLKDIGKNKWSEWSTRY